MKPSWTEDTYTELTKLGVIIHFKEYPNVAHEMIHREIQDLQEWIGDLVPPISRKELKDTVLEDPQLML